ncbi:MAG TPA: plastocyanin/azurin family copper-binding protein [Anaerolineaceae bacterium]|nr:plastocyanin/azurin family copper-binding protein [Anaerolineaceae bacterium]
MKRTSIVLSLFIVFSMVLSACGGGSGSGATTNITTAMSDFKFDPAEWTVPAGEEITLQISNTGQLEHDWILMMSPATIPFDTDDEANVVTEVEQEPGENTSFKFTAPSEPGDYQVVCGIPGHLEAGMKGTLHVVEQ